MILSYNCRCLASQPKKLALRELVKCYDPNVLRLQETLGLGIEVVGSISRMFLVWGFQAMDAHGRLGGLALGIKSGRLKEISSWGFENALVMEVNSNELCYFILLLNFYGHG